MKISEIIGLVDRGILKIDAKSLSNLERYKVVKFRKSVRAAVDDFSSSIVDVQQEAGVTDPAAFDKRRAELLSSEHLCKEDEAELAEMNAKFKSFSDLRAELLKEDVEVFSPRLDYDSWMKLKEDNRTDDENEMLSGWAEEVLEDVLWIAPEN